MRCFLVAAAALALAMRASAGPLFEPFLSRPPGTVDLDFSPHVEYTPMRPQRRGNCPSTARDPVAGCSAQAGSASPPRGIYIDTATCTGTRLRQAQDALEDMSRLAAAGLSALRNQLGAPHPFPYFFAPSDKPWVDRVLSAAIRYKFGVDDGEPIRVTCKDHSRNQACKMADVTGFSNLDPVDGRAIVLCKAFFLLKRNVAPCTGGLSTDGITGIGATTAGYLLLHEFTHAATSNQIDDYAYGSANCHRLVAFPHPAKSPQRNADSFALYCSWSWDVGLADGQTPCLDMFQPAANGFIGGNDRD
ncbi:MAG: hypothetical protein M1832_000472 [Thelocarpon impressellum]|nr:MAG: hypothetical protein M1832_000472 [Thelocarpon impressellum]